MLTINFNGQLPTLLSSYYGIQLNNKCDVVCFVLDAIQDDLDLRTCSAYVKSCSRFNDFYDKEQLDIQELDDNKIQLEWTLERKHTQFSRIEAQLQFETKDDIVWQTKTITLNFSSTIKADSYITNTYPETLIDIRNAVDEITNKVDELSDITELQSIIETKADSSDIPTSTSQLTNDSGYITKAVSDLTNYYLKSETYTQDEIDEMVSAIPKFAIKVVDTLPTKNISETTVYLLKSGDDDGNLYTEYIYVNSVWEKLGSQTVDLIDVNNKLEENATNIANEISRATSAESTLESNITLELENYVKNTDYATNSVFGIARADQINGIQATDGVLSIMGATDTQVNAKASNGRPLQAKHIDKIVQLGITTNTNTLTEEEQASAQEWLGISGVSTEYELINTITLTEETAYIHFDTTDDGDAWDFDSVALEITIPICGTARRVIVCGLSSAFSSSSYAIHLGMSSSTSAITHIVSEIKKFGGSGRYITESSYATGTSWVSFSGTTYKNFREVFSDNATYFGDRLTSLYVYLEGVSSYPLPVDTVVKVYGKK